MPAEQRRKLQGKVRARLKRLAARHPMPQPA
jgi:hypothetical protein